MKWSTQQSKSFQRSHFEASSASVWWNAAKITAQGKAKQFVFILRKSFPAAANYFKHKTDENDFKFMKSNRVWITKGFPFLLLSVTLWFDIWALITIDFATWWLLFIPRASCSSTITNNYLAIEIHGKSFLLSSLSAEFSFTYQQSRARMTKNGWNEKQKPEKNRFDVVETPAAHNHEPVKHSSQFAMMIYWETMKSSSKLVEIAVMSF